ncbi:MAG: nitroreductase family protein, partial [Thermoplasmata archaeon]|nr:nitroreductase family protein [Thermoplasmata archaeon]
ISSYGNRGEEFYVLQDVAAAVENFLLYIHSQGLGAVWIGAFNDAEVSRILALPPMIRPVAIVPVGIPGEVPARRPRRNLDDLIHREKWTD